MAILERTEGEKSNHIKRKGSKGFPTMGSPMLEDL